MLRIGSQVRDNRPSYQRRVKLFTSLSPQDYDRLMAHVQRTGIKAAQLFRDGAMRLVEEGERS